ncbi:MAG: hypothetical protein ACI857_002655, partial [Arenicella sp.]
MRHTLFILAIILGSTTIAQTSFDISGKIMDENKIGVDLALISLYNSSDSTLMKTELTDTDGSFTISSVESGKYIFKVKYTGFLDHSEAIDVAESFEMKAITLKINKNVLGAVTVDGTVPFAVRKIDRIVITPDALIASTGSNALEILEQAPGVTVDQNGQVVLKGRTGVAIYINDKPSYLSGSELENYLRSLPAGSIKDIEIIENPPARY